VEKDIGMEKVGRKGELKKSRISKMSFSVEWEKIFSKEIIPVTGKILKLLLQNGNE
jgi:hypothetical protein